MACCDMVSIPFLCLLTSIIHVSTESDIIGCLFLWRDLLKLRGTPLLEVCDIDISGVSMLSVGTSTELIISEKGTSVGVSAKLTPFERSLSPKGISILVVNKLMIIVYILL